MRKQTLEERLVNEAFSKYITSGQFKRKAQMLPTLAEIIQAKILWPEQKGLLALAGYCKTALENNHWSVKVVYALDRVAFPQTTQEKKTEQERLAECSAHELAKVSRFPLNHKLVARLLAHYRAALTEKQYNGIRQGLLGFKIKEWLANAAWKQDDLFFIQFGEALQTEGRSDCKKAHFYRFLLRNSEAVEACKTKTEIMNLPGFPQCDASTAYKDFKKFGLPMPTT